MSATSAMSTAPRPALSPFFGFAAQKAPKASSPTPSSVALSSPPQARLDRLCLQPTQNGLVSRAEAFYGLEDRWSPAGTGVECGRRAGVGRQLSRSASFYIGDQQAVRKPAVAKYTEDIKNLLSSIDNLHTCSPRAGGISSTMDHGSPRSAHFGPPRVNLAGPVFSSL